MKKSEWILTAAANLDFSKSMTSNQIIPNGQFLPTRMQITYLLPETLERIERAADFLEQKKYFDPSISPSGITK